MDALTVLNYQGSKKNLMGFIHDNLEGVSVHGQTMLDIFSGTCSVGYSFKRSNRVYANDCEAYAFIISKALLGGYSNVSLKEVRSAIGEKFCINMATLNARYETLLNTETLMLNEAVTSKVVQFYKSVPTVWNCSDNVENGNYDLFIRYYSTSYFGLLQAAEIDSLRFAVEGYKHTELFAPLLTSLYFAMKECVFAKDGHMAQPLDIEKNFHRLLKQREKSIFDLFNEKLTEFFSAEFVVPQYANKAFNLDFEDLLRLPEIQKEVDWIYADPPYTDMQYSRYYHLLNFVTEYRPLARTRVKGAFTKGLYTEGRYQSKLSVKSKCLDTFTALIDFSHRFHKNLMVSFAYPADVEGQKTDRYVMSVDALTEACVSRFGVRGVEVSSCDYTHSNNRNSKPKKVCEYLIVCRSK